MSITPVIRPAHLADLAELHRVIERAYRGETARSGWTHEADLIPQGDRTDPATLAGLVSDPASRLLVALDGETIIGCVNVQDRGDRTAYLGLLCVDPTLQAGGFGRQLVAAAERTARNGFGAVRMEMTVIEQRTELIAWYERLGYVASGERRDFPVPMDPPFFMTVLVKPLG